jgi:hypothetical protein
MTARNFHFTLRLHQRVLSLRIYVNLDLQETHLLDGKVATTSAIRSLPHSAGQQITGAMQPQQHRRAGASALH